MGGGVRRRGGHRSRKSVPAGTEADESAAPLAAAPVQPKRGSARSSQGIKPSAEEVLLAIQSLYVDELKPFGRILRKRVAEQHIEQHDLGIGGNLPDVDIKHLKAMCDGNSQLEVQPEEGGDWSAMIRGRPAHFVDIYSSDDSYESATWNAARKYFESLPEDMALLPGGRYSCAQALMDRNLDFLAGFSLGKVCHLVQLAISKHKALGYCNGAVVPYSRSQSKVKEDCAVYGQPCQSSADALGAVPAGVPTLSLATWEVARNCLQEVLESAAVPDSTEPASVPLSNVKRLFRSKYQIELSETSLGHSKLSELLQDSRFSDICEVQLQGQGYIVVQVDRPKADSASGDGHPISLTSGLLPPWDALHPLEGLLLTPVRASSPMEEPDDFEDCYRQEFCPEEPLNLEDAGLLLLPGTCSGHPSPLQPLPTPLGSPGAPTPNTVSRWPAYAQMWHSTGPSELYGSEGPRGACGVQAATWNWPQQPSLPMAASWVDTHCAMFDHGVSDSTESTADSARSVAGRSTRAVQSPSSSSCLGRLGEPQSPAPDDPPMKISLMRAFDDQAEPFLQLAQMPLDEEPDEPRSRVPFCPDEPLILEDAGFFEGAPKVLSGMGSDVKNTFIQMATTPLVTPQPGASRRSRSVPKDVGCSQEDAVAPASRAHTPAFVLPPTPSSPVFCTSYEVMTDPSADPLNALNRVIRLADLI